MQPLTHGEAQDLLGRYKAAREQRDPDLALDLFAPDAEHRDDPFRDAIRGANEIRALWNEMAASQVNAEFEAERIWVSGATVLASFHGAHTDRATADRVRTRGFMTLELDDERRISRLRAWPISRIVGRDSTVPPETSDQTDRRIHGR